MSYNLKGTLYLKRETQVISDKFQKREFVIKTDGDYPQFVQMELTQDRTSLLDNLTEGSELSINFDVRGREWRNKEGKAMFFNTLNAYRIELTGNAMAPSSSFEDEDKPPF